MRGLFWKIFGIFWLSYLALGALLHAFGKSPTYLPQPGDSGLLLPISLLLSALLSWYQARPLHTLRNAFHAMIAGRLDTRVHVQLSRQGGLVAELGRDFDSMAQRLEHFVGSQQQVLQHLTHELRSPLSRQHAAIDLARQDPQKLYATLERIEHESRRIETMLESLLLQARLESGNTGGHAAPTDLRALLANVVADARFETQAQGREIHLSCNESTDDNVAGSDPCIVDAQADLLHRAIENVIRNALKFSGADTAVHVELIVKATHAYVVVMDRGPGVAADELTRIFKPFYRSPHITAPKTGFGLGLAIAQKIIETHRGHIAATNRKSGGLAVTIFLPAAAFAED